MKRNLYSTIIVALAWLFGLLLSAWSCAAVDPALKLARSAATFASVSDPIFRGMYEAEQRACLARPDVERDPCITEVRARWAPIRKALGDIREAWCEFEPEKCSAQQAAKGTP